LTGGILTGLLDADARTARERIKTSTRVAMALPAEEGSTLDDSLINGLVNAGRLDRQGNRI
jgi:hypothetical protein